MWVFDDPVSGRLPVQDSPTVIVHRRTEQGFVSEKHLGLEAIIPLSEIGIELSLAEIYDGFEFIPEPDSDEVE